MSSEGNHGRSHLRRFLRLIPANYGWHVSRKLCELLDAHCLSALARHSSSATLWCVSRASLHRWMPWSRKGYVSLEGDTTPFGNYGVGTVGVNTSVATRAYGLTDVLVKFDASGTDPRQLIQGPSGQLEYTNGGLSKSPRILRADGGSSRPRRLVNIAKAPILYCHRPGIHSHSPMITAPRNSWNKRG